MERVTKDDLSGVAVRLVAQLLEKREENRASLVTLEGELGAGKTTFVQALARVLGIEETVVSPTYVLMKSYKLAGQPWERLVHIDAYRLNDAGEFAALEPASFLLDPAALVVVEWPSRIEGALPKPNMALALSSEGAGEGERYITF
jgi:tRNA threonylcarbamoyladenosine biosynthesis protein TsaE